MQNAEKTKIYYIDNLRVLLTVLVILHHTFITYGAPGGWYYTDKTTNAAALIVMTLFVATNQSFFMGFFFFLSAFFTEASYNKKGAKQFVADRLKRLGIPLLFYSFILSPILNFLVYRFGFGKQATFLQYLTGYDDWIDFGVLWFVAALLIFTLVYVALKYWYKSASAANYKLLSNTSIVVFALSLGIISYLVRIIFPVGWVLHPLGFQFAHFTQYIALFILGIFAARNQWLNSINFGQGKRYFIYALVLVFVIFPLVYAVNTITHNSLDAFQGNGTWQSFLAAVWEQLTGIFIMVALIGIGKQKWNITNPLLQKMARSAYATYIIHPLAVITFCLLLKPLQIDPAFKLLIAAPLAVTTSFCLAWFVTRIPVVKNIV